MYHSTSTDEIVELKLDDVPLVNGYHSTQEHRVYEHRDSEKDVEGAGKLKCSCGENACEGVITIAVCIVWTLMIP